MFRKLAKAEENLWSDLVERWAAKDPEEFWRDDRPPKHRTWEAVLLTYWPRILTISYWYYLFAYIGGGPNELGYSTGYEAGHWVNLPTWGEWRYLGRSWNGKWLGFKSIWISLYEETKLERLICRLRNHPEGEIYYTSYGDEPDHHCKTCGEMIG